MANTRESMGDQATLDGLVNRTLTSIEEDGVTTMGNYALYKNTALTSVNFPSLTNTGTYSMQGCTALETATLPEATTIGNYAFSGCTSLDTVSAPKVTAVNQYAFQNCTALESLSLPLATTVGDYGFSGCANLSTLTAPLLQSLGKYGLKNCKCLNSITTTALKTIGNYAFDSSGIGELVLPVCTSLGTYTGQGLRMSTIDITNNITIAANKFNGANALVHLILRSSSMCSLSATSAFTGTPIANGKGWIYVPSDLVSTYQAATNWSTYSSQIVAISEYPKTLQDETITDSWSDIFSAETNGTYSTDYSVGDIKYLDVGGTQLAMELVAIDTDTLTAGGTAKMTWLSKNLLELKGMNDSDVTTDGWAQCGLRDFLRNVIYPQIDSTVRSQIQAVDKTYYDYTTSSTLTVSDTVWIPSAREMFGGSSYESSGCDYTSYFTANSGRIKYKGGSSAANYWWLRSAYSATYFRYVITSGSVTNVGASSVNGVALGFCT